MIMVCRCRCCCPRFCRLLAGFLAGRFRNSWWKILRRLNAFVDLVRAAPCCSVVARSASMCSLAVTLTFNSHGYGAVHYPPW